MIGDGNVMDNVGIDNVGDILADFMGIELDINIGMDIGANMVNVVNVGDVILLDMNL